MKTIAVLLFALLGVAASTYWEPEPEFYECCADGDPHYSLFDGQWIHYQGKCKYLMAGTCHNCTDCDNAEPFHVNVDNRPWQWNSAMSVTDLVEILYMGNTIVFQNSAPQVLINGATPTLPFVHSGFVVSQPDAWTYQFESTSGIRVRYRWGSSACIRVPSCLYRGQMCGICGNMNNMQDDYFTSAGTDVSGVWPLQDRYDAIGDSWEVSGGDCPPDVVAAGDVTARRKRRQAEVLPVEQIPESPCCQMVEKSGQFAKCLAGYGTGAQGFFDSCNIDAYYGRESANACCMMIRAFAEACRDKGLAPEAGWMASFPQCREEFAQMQQQRG